MIKHLLLDLDNTLYPESCGMDEGITRRMIEFISHFLNVSLDEAFRLRQIGLPPYGTTLEWLKAKHGLQDENTYFAAVHPESEIEELQKDPALRPFLLSLELPLTLLTNAPMSHAKRLLKFFDIEDIFIGIFDLTFHKGVGKPNADCFLSTLASVGFSVEDDHVKYVRGYKAVGGKAVIVDETGVNKKLALDEGFGLIQSIYELKALITTKYSNS